MSTFRRMICLLPLVAGIVMLLAAGCRRETAMTPEPIFPSGTASTKIKEPAPPPSAEKPTPPAAEKSIALAEKKPSTTAAEQPAAPAAKPTPPAAKPSPSGPPTKAEIAAAKKAGTQRAVISTVRGDMTVELYGADAPGTVANFVKLVKAKLYDGLTFHRVESDPQFSLIQGGDPEGNGAGGPGYGIDREISPKLRHVKGALAMARSQDPNSAGCQFYICRVAIPQLDDQYAVFGKVVKGLEAADKIQVGDKITRITMQ